MSSLSLVYHPRFEPPAAWLRSMLLFHDRVYSIVPSELEPTFSVL